MALFLGSAAGVVVARPAREALDRRVVRARRPGRRRPASPAGPTPVLGDLVRIAKTYNDGGIFGLFDAAAPLLGLLSVAIIAGIAWYEWRHGAAAGPLVTVGLGLLLGGALGNLIDRARFGHVIDFVDMGIGERALLRVQRRRRGDQHRHPPAHRRGAAG